MPMNDHAPNDGYEFSGAQNNVFTSLASAMKFVGIVSTILGGLSLTPVLFSPVTLLVNGPQAALLIVIGIWTTRASNSVQAIVDTQGNDIHHLMTAMDGLSKLYRLQRALMILGLVLMLILVAVLVVSGGAILATIAPNAN